MHQRIQRAAFGLLTIGVLLVALPLTASAAVVLTEDIVFRGGAGETATWSVDTSAVAGQTCTVSYSIENGPSEHAGNILRVTSTGDGLQADAIEATANAVTSGSGGLEMGDTLDTTIQLSSDPDDQWRAGVWVFSGRLTLDLSCADTTTTTEATTTTTTEATTTTTGSDTTSTTQATTTTTGVGSTTTTVLGTTTTTGGGSATSTTTLPPVTPSTLPFTGSPADLAGLAMAATALLMLGGGSLLAARSES